MVRLSFYVIVAALAGAWGCGGASLSEEHGQAGAADGGASSGSGGSVSGGHGGTGGAGGSGAKGGTPNGGTSGSANGGTSGSPAAGGVGGTSGSSTGGSGGDAIGGVGGVAASGGDAGVLGGTSGSGLGGAGGSVAGQGGASGTAGGGTCTDSDTGMSGTNPNAILGTTVGDNGTFTDECDANGNLLEHSCEYTPCGLTPKVAFPTGGAGGIPCMPIQTGQAIEQVIDCGGLCHDGTCFDWCATNMDVFQVTAVEGSTLSMTRDSYGYSCTVAFQRDGFDCLSQEMVGRELIVTSLGTCAGASTTFGWDDPGNPLLEECAFTCSALL